MTVKTALRDLNNAVLDLQSAEYNTFERPLVRLAAALNADELKPLTERLKSNVDFDAFLASATPTGGMMGSARLNWPADLREELGLAINLIERAAVEPDWFLEIAHVFYFSGRKISDDIRKLPHP